MPHRNRQGHGPVPRLRGTFAILLLLFTRPAAAQLGARGGSDEPKEKIGTIALSAPPDAQIAQRLTAIVREVEELSHVSVQVRQGVVHLRGETDTIAARERIAEIAQRIEGVAAVDNDIQQLTSFPKRLSLFRTDIIKRLERLLSFLPLLAFAVLTFVPFVLISKVLKHSRQPFLLLAGSELKAAYVNLAFRIGLVLVGLILALDVLGVMEVVGAVVGTLGLLGVVFGLAFKDLIANYLPGVLLSLRPPFATGDLVQIGDYEGNVLRVTPWATSITSRDGEHLRIPNATVFRQTIINYSRYRERRLRFSVSLEFHADLRRARDVGRQALLRIPEIVSDPEPFMRVSRLGHDCIEVEFFAWMDQSAGSFRHTESVARRAVRDAFLAANIAVSRHVLLVGRLGDTARPPEAPTVKAPDEDFEAVHGDESFLQSRVQREIEDSPEADLLEKATSKRRASMRRP